MEFKELELPGVWSSESELFYDNRGYFREWFQRDEFRRISGIDFEVAQSNCSVSNKNVMRGIHYSKAKQGQAKWVTCASGLILDAVIDLRNGSEYFGKSLMIELDSKKGTCIYIPDGFGHGFKSLEDNSLVAYSLTSKYEPTQEFTLNLFDEELGLNWPSGEAILSERDRNAPEINSITW